MIFSLARIIYLRLSRSDILKKLGAVLTQKIVLNLTYFSDSSHKQTSRFIMLTFKGKVLISDVHGLSKRGVIHQAFDSNHLLYLEFGLVLGVGGSAVGHPKMTVCLNPFLG